MALAAYMADKDATAPKYAMHLNRMLSFLKVQKGNKDLTKLISIMEQKTPRVAGDWTMEISRVMLPGNSADDAWGRVVLAIAIL